MSKSEKLLKSNTKFNGERALLYGVEVSMRFVLACQEMNMRPLVQPIDGRPDRHGQLTVSDKCAMTSNGLMPADIPTYMRDLFFEFDMTFEYTGDVLEYRPGVVAYERTLARSEWAPTALPAMLQVIIRDRQYRAGDMCKIVRARLVFSGD